MEKVSARRTSLQKRPQPKPRAQGWHRPSHDVLLYVFTLVLLFIYILPLFMVPFTYLWTGGFVRESSLYDNLAQQLSPGNSAVNELTIVLAPFMAFLGSALPARSWGALLVGGILILAFSITFLDQSIIGDPQNLNSIQAFLPDGSLDSRDVDGLFRRYREVILTLLFGLLGVRFVLHRDTSGAP